MESLFNLIYLTGYQIFSYDKLGNVSENIRTFALPFEDSLYNFRMMFEYDSWNRVQRIVYPDSEVVMYNYDLGGNLNRVHTYKANHRDTLIKNILYDEFGHRTQVNFGNGVTTNYTYDILQRLSLLETKKPSSPALQKISYSFDLEDNITRVANTTAPVNGIGGSYTFDYQYDNLYRLTSSTGSFAPTNASYFLEMHYTPAGRICRKEQGDNNATKRLLYSYNPNNAPHAARRIYDPSTTNLRQMLWDANGNIAQIAEYLYDATNEIVNLQDFRNHYWDEDDRLSLVLDNSHFSYYLYGNDGQRVAKLTGSAFTLGTGFATNALLDNYTLYPSEYLTITTQGYTKYYYANGTRIASKLGSGGFEKMQRLCTEELNLTANANALFNSVVANIGTAMPDYHISDPCPSYYSDISGFRVPLPTLNFDPNFGITAQQNLLQTFRQNYANEEIYYFHGNHLGSANWVTLQNASPTQFLLHLPYGEEFVKQLSSTYDERFTFTGKEKDIETGYYYFGARFDNVDLGFLSVDPMSDKYPSLTPYNYCAWNPVKLVDPDGEEADDPPKSRITVQNGYVVLKMDNLHNSTRNKINAFNYDTGNWPEGYIGAIGPLAHIEYKTPELLDPKGGYGYSQPSDHSVRTKAVTAKSTGLPDKRVTPRAIPSSGSKGMNIALVAIDATIFTLNAIAYCFWNNDMKNVRNQISMLGSAFEDVKMYDIEIGLPGNYRTPEQMLYIANYVLQKENVTKDPMVKQIGDVIRARNNYKYNKQIQQCTGE